MSEILGYDHFKQPIYEYQFLRAIGSYNIDVRSLKNADPRYYCSLIGEDDNAYAISVFDWLNEDIIRERENIPPQQSIQTVVKPISEMVNYEKATKRFDDDLFMYELIDFEELKKELNKILRREKKQRNKKSKTIDVILGYGNLSIIEPVVAGEEIMIRYGNIIKAGTTREKERMKIEDELDNILYSKPVALVKKIQRRINNDKK